MVRTLKSSLLSSHPSSLAVVADQLRGVCQDDDGQVRSLSENLYRTDFFGAGKGYAPSPCINIFSVLFSED
jgi:hypothetical protein